MTSVSPPAVDEILDTAVVVSVPMRTRFRGQTSREVMLFRGPAGWAEFGPFPEYGAPEASLWLAAGIEAAFTGLGVPRRWSIPVNATVPAVAADQVSSVLAQYGDLDAVPAVKIKVAEPGQTIDDDVARVRAVRKRLPDAGLRVDANGAWSLDEAVRGLGRILEAAGGELEYAEQPVAGVEPLAQLREALQKAGVPVRIAADEAVRKADDPLRVARLGAAELIVVKAAPLGGVQPALEVVAQSGLDAVVSSALDTSVGLTSGLALAARLPQLPYACGLGTAAMFTSEVVDRPLRPADGHIPVPVETVEQGRLMGQGRLVEKGSTGKGSAGQAAVIRAPQPDPELLQRHRVGPERQRWWRTRLRAAHQVLAASATGPQR